MSNWVELHIPCEDCGSSDAKCVHQDGHSYCFSCEAYHRGDKDISNVEFTYEYLPWRGVSAESFRFFDAKTKIDPSGVPVSIGYRYPNGAFKVRSLEGKHFHSVGDIGKAGLYGQDRFAAGSHKYVTITEGELDAISLWQVLRTPVVSVRSSVSAVADVAAARSWLSSFERVYLCFDADTPGREATASVAKLFDFNRVWDVKFSNRKDANEYLQHGEAEELLNIWKNSKKFIPSTVVTSLDDFAKILKGGPIRGVSYPWTTLDSMTFGIRTGETVLITAQEGIGKTEIMHALEYQLLKDTSYGVGAFFLEEPKKRHLQAIAGIQLRKPVHLPSVSCSEDEVFRALKEVVATDERLYLYSHFGSDDPEVLLDTIRYLVCACGVRYVLIDHVSMVPSGSASEDERRTLDYLTTRLEMMVKELDFGLIIVSHVNDDGKTRSSRWIGKIADIRIDVTRDLLNPDYTLRNTTFLNVSKNRFSGKTGYAGKLFFDTETFTFNEILEAANDNQLGRPELLAVG
jgi:twinkle protein